MKNERFSIISLFTMAAIIISTVLMPVGSTLAQNEGHRLISSIALMPFWLGEPTPGITLEKKNVLDCTLAELCYLEGNPLQGATDILNEITQPELVKRFHDKIVPFETAEKAYNTLDKEDSDTLRSIAVRFGKKLGVDQVVAGTLWRYQERQGNSIAAESPASVAFSLFLINVENGEILWNGIFNETQTALSENILNASIFAKKGLKWLTAKEFATAGVEKLLQKMPY